MPESTNRTIKRLVVALLGQLHAKGFAIGVDSYVDALAVTDKFLRDRPDGNEDVHELGKHLSPLLCRNRDEQRDFDFLFSHLFSDLMSDEAEKIQRDIENVEHKRSVIGYIRWSVAIITLIIAAVIIIPPQFTTKPEVTGTSGTYYLSYGDSFVKTASQLLRDPQDTSSVQIEQYLGSEGPVTNFNYSFTPKRGEHLLTTRVYSTRHSIDTSFTDTLLVSPRVDITIFQSEVVTSTRRPVTYTLVKNDSLDFPYSWYVSDHSGALLTNRQKFQYIFLDTGAYVVSVKYQVPADPFYLRFPADHFSTRITQRVAGNQMTIVSAATPLPDQEVNPKVNPWWLITIAGVVAALIGYMTVLFRREQSLKNIIEKKPAEPALDPMHGKGPPFDITFRSTFSDITESKLLGKISGNLIKTIETHIRHLDFKNSVRETIRNAEFITPVYKNRKQLQYYLMLLDEEYANSQQYRLFHYLAQYFLRKSVNIDVYSYNEFPDQLFKSGEIESISLHDLTGAYRDSTLIVFSSGHSLTEYKSRQVRPAYHDVFSLWEKRILVTPVPFDDWSSQEKVLSSLFEVVPADIIGLLEVIRLLQDQADNSTARAKANLSTYSADVVDFQRIESLSKYLNNDQELIQWLCALSVYPKVDWNLTIEIGKAVLGTNSHKINYTNLLKFARIRWMHEGRFTSTVRAELLKNLTVENELKTRATILKLLDDIKIDPSSFSYEEKMVNVYTNSFILFATSAENKSIYRPIYNKDAEIEANAKKYVLLYKEKKLLDVAFHQYTTLGNTVRGERWTTPIMVGGKNVDIDTFIMTPEKHPEPPKFMQQFYLAGLFALLLSLAVVALYTFKERIAVNPLNASMDFVMMSSQPADPSIQITVCDELLNRLNGDSVYFAGVQGTDTLFSGYETVAAVNSTEGDIAGPVTIFFSLSENSYSKKIEVLPGYRYTISLEGRMCRRDTYDSIFIYAPQSQLATANLLIDTLQNFGGVRVEQVATGKRHHIISYNRSSDSVRAATIQGAVAGVLGSKPIIRPESDSSIVSGNNVHVWLEEIVVPERPLLSIKYCPSIPRVKVEKFADGLAGSFRVVRLQEQRGTCISEVRYSGLRNRTAVSILSNRASRTFGMSVKLMGSTTRSESMIELFINAAKTTILWVDDHPENNSTLVTMLSKYKIDVDFATSNVEALQKLNSNTYALIIADVSRDKPERCVQDITSAGIEFASAVNFPKNLIFLYSASLNMSDSKIQRASTIIPRENIIPSSPKLIGLIMETLEVANDARYTQNLNCEKECAPSSSTEGLVLFYERATSALNSESRELLAQTITTFDERTEVSVNSFSYSATATAVSNEGKSENNLREILNYLDKMDVKVSASSARGDDNRIPDSDCDRLEISITRRQVSYKYDTIRSELGYENRVTGRIYENIPLKQAGVELTLQARPVKEAIFNIVVRNRKCPESKASAMMRLGDEPKVIFSDCGVMLTIKVLDIGGRKVSFEAYLRTEVDAVIAK